MYSGFLRDISVVWSLLHVLILFIVFYQSRYPIKKTIALTGIFMGSLLVLISALVFIKGAMWVANWMIVLCVLPSLLFFWLLSSQRDGRFIFTFCFVDTVSLWWLVLTMILNYLLTPDSYLVIFIGRLVGFPVFEYLVYYRFRKPYLEAQRAVSKGWGSFAAVTVVFYALLLVASLYPTNFYSRPEILPVLLLLLLLLPLMYNNIFQILLRQQRLTDAEEQMRILNAQAAMMERRVNQTMESEKQISIHRHDLRHRLQTIYAMLQEGETGAAMDYISASQEALTDVKDKRWCANSVMNAVFTAYFRQAEAEGIRIETDMDIPASLSVDAVELSTVFANALENAIQAVKGLPRERRVICCKCIRYPQLMFSVSNPYKGKVRFDENGCPAADAPSHGTGTRSIAAYCEKHGAVCRYKAVDGWFTIQIVQTIQSE